MINEEQLKEFKALYKKEFGEDISDAAALDSATRLINLLKVVYKPMSKTEFDEFRRRKEGEAAGVDKVGI